MPAPAAIIPLLLTKSHLFWSLFCGIFLGGSSLYAFEQFYDPQVNSTSKTEPLINPTTQSFAKEYVESGFDISFMWKSLLTFLMFFLLPTLKVLLSIVYFSCCNISDDRMTHNTTTTTTTTKNPTETNSIVNNHHGPVNNIYIVGDDAIQQFIDNPKAYTRLTDSGQVKLLNKKVTDSGQLKTLSTKPKSMKLKNQ
jgi:hypothetical protein